MHHVDGRVIGCEQHEASDRIGIEDGCPYAGKSTPIMANDIRSGMTQCAYQTQRILRQIINLITTRRRFCGRPIPAHEGRDGVKARVRERSKQRSEGCGAIGKTVKA